MVENDKICIAKALENRLFSEGLHVLGAPLSEPQLSKYLQAYFGEEVPESIVAAVSASQEDSPVDIERLISSIKHSEKREELIPKVQEAKEIRDLLSKNSGEITSILEVQLFNQ